MTARASGPDRMMRFALAVSARVFASRSGRSAGGSSDPFYRHKLASARFYADHLLPRSAGLLVTVQADNGLVLELEDEAF